MALRAGYYGVNRAQYNEIKRRLSGETVKSEPTKKVVKKKSRKKIIKEGG